MSSVEVMSWDQGCREINIAEENMLNGSLIVIKRDCTRRKRPARGEENSEGKEGAHEVIPQAVLASNKTAGKNKGSEVKKTKT